MKVDDRLASPAGSIHPTAINVGEWGEAGFAQLDSGESPWATGGAGPKMAGALTDSRLLHRKPGRHLHRRGPQPDRSAVRGRPERCRCWGRSSW